MTLYREDGEEAGLREIVDWFNENYPSHVFIRHPIAIVRGLLNAMDRKVLTTQALERKDER